MVIELPHRILEQNGLSEKDILLSIAISLFQDQKLTLAQAAQIADLHQIRFQLELVRRNIPIHYGEEEYQNDLKMIAYLE
ncbi:MAG: UPF0175 family protein [Spirosomaceae bacterium]|jgi:predicted HTH domain antitoxin|nr:UPF0175 family protein [Spirosomataceae bacterium]